MSRVESDACREQLKSATGERGVDVTVSTAPPLVASLYETAEFTCPHGITYYLEPTGEQIATWVKDRAP